MNSWFRMHAEFLTDPKVQMLTETDQRRYIMALCMRCSNGDVTLHDVTVAFQLRISNKEWAETKRNLIDKNLICEDNKPTAWSKRQYQSDQSNQRVAKHRATKKQLCNVTVTPPDTDTDSDTERKKESPYPQIEKLAKTPLTGQMTIEGNIPTFEKPNMTANDVGTEFWKKALNPPSEQGEPMAVVDGAVKLFNGTRTKWLEEFDGDAKALDLALIEIAHDVQPNSPRPLTAQVEKHLARIVRNERQQSKRYASAIERNQAAKTGKPKPTSKAMIEVVNRDAQKRAVQRFLETKLWVVHPLVGTAPGTPGCVIPHDILTELGVGGQ